MIEIQARLVREKSAVFLAGEVVECFVTFKNVPSFENLAESNNGPSGGVSCAVYEPGTGVVENLAWATVSIQCYFWSAAALKSNEIPIASSTSLTPSGLGTVVVQTKPKFMFCDLVLKPNDIKTYLFKEAIPKKGPPTYRGNFVKYFYKVSIATQRVGSTVQMLQVPIRVLPICFTTEEALAAICDGTEDAISPVNPFLIKQKQEYLELMLEYLQNISSRRCPNFYMITNKHGKVGRFCIFKSIYKLGEDIVCTLDFSIQTVKCIQYSVILECEEIMLSSCTSDLRNGKSSPADGSSLEDETDASKIKPIKTKVTEHSKYHEVTVGLNLSEIILPVPLYVSPSFKTDQVEVKWRLHFQFVTSTNPNFDFNCASGKSWQAPKEIEIETMIWNLPIQLLPTNPITISQASENLSLKIN